MGLLELEIFIEGKQTNTRAKFQHAVSFLTALNMKCHVVDMILFYVKIFRTCVDLCFSMSKPTSALKTEPRIANLQGGS